MKDVPNWFFIMKYLTNYFKNILFFPILYFFIRLGKIICLFSTILGLQMFIRMLIYHTILKFYNYDSHLYSVQLSYTKHDYWENKNEWLSNVL